MKIKYRKVRLNEAALATIAQINKFTAEYRKRGLDLTLRQLYYRFVTANLIPNNEKEYKRLGTTLGFGRIAGLIDWDIIVDRTRGIEQLNTWESPQEVLELYSKVYRLDKWARQPMYCECWVEKDALIGVVGAACKPHEVPYMACRGYASASELWRAGHERIRPRILNGQQVMIFYLGDHDPSGIDMTRDVIERVSMFAGLAKTKVEVVRLALNMDQVEFYNPPPNPTKMTDTRSVKKDGTGYHDIYGDTCWELDALDPVAIRDLIDNAIINILDRDLWDQALAEEATVKKQLARIAKNWDDVIENLP